MTCLDRMIGIMGWMTRKSGHGQPCNLNSKYQQVTDSEKGWESLPADIFDKVVALVGRECVQTLGSLRCVCTHWKYNINNRLHELRIFRRPCSPPTALWRTFLSLKKLTVICSPDLECSKASEVWEDITRLGNLKELNIVRCKGKLSIGAECLCEMYKLETLWLDGSTLSQLAQKGSSLPSVVTLVLGDCKSLGDEELSFLLRCRALQRLVVLDVGDLPKSHVEKIGKALHIQELALVGAGPEFDLHHLSNLKKLIIRQGSTGHELFDRVSKLPSLKILSLSGCEDVQNGDWEQLKQLPGLEHLRLCGGVDSDMKLQANEPASVDSLAKLELFQCPGVDEVALRASLRSATDLRLIQEPDQALAKVVKEAESTEAIQSFLESVQEPNMPEVPVCGSFFTPEMFTDLASQKKHDVIDLMVQYGADVDYGNPMLISTAVADLNCSTPLHFAVHNRDSKWVQKLLDLGARANASCAEDLRTPLHLSVQWDDLDLVKILLSAGAYLGSRDEELRTPLHYAVKWASDAVIRKLVEQGADPSIRDFNMVSPIGFAAEQGNTDIMDLLLELGMDVNEGSKVNDPTPLHRASKVGDVDMVKYLMSKGADLLARIENGSTPIMLAGKEGNREVVEYFLTSFDFGPHALDMADNVGMTVLHHAAWHGWVEVVEDLIQRNAQVNKGDVRGFTPLYYADTNGHLEAVHKLSRAGGLAFWFGRKKLYKYPWLISCGCGSKYP